MARTTTNGTLKLWRDMGDCRRFHLYSNGLWEVVADFRQTNRTVDESVAANNQATYSVKIQFGNAGLSGSDQFIVSFKACRTASVTDRIHNQMP